MRNIIDSIAERCCSAKKTFDGKYVGCIISNTTTMYIIMFLVQDQISLHVCGVVEGYKKCPRPSMVGFNKLLNVSVGS